MKKLFVLIIFSSYISAQVDWSNPNACKLPNQSDLTKRILNNMTLEQKVGHVIMPEINSVTPEEAKKYQFGTILNGGGGFPNQNKNSSVQDWKNLSKSYYEASPVIDGVRVPILWGTDAVHGHNNVIGATIFPHNIGLGATRNELLVRKIGNAVAKEVASTGIIWTFAPTVAVPKNDLWGRTYEGFSENTDLVSSLGKSFIIGLQGESESFLDEDHILATVKHFVGDGGTNNGIDQGNTIIDEFLLKEVHAKPYYDAINECALSIMASFNSWNGKKMHGNKYLLTEVLKSQMGFNGFIVGDWNGHGQVPGCINTDCPQSLNAGLDMYMAPDSWKGLYESTIEHVKDGTISMERLDDAVRRILRVKIASGIFEKGLPSSRLNAGDESKLALPENRKIARSPVRES